MIDKKKKFLLVVCACLLVVTLTGCGQGYSAGKLYWQANAAVREITKGKTQDNLTKEDYQKIIGAYRRVVERYPLEPLAAQSQFIIAQIYILQRQYDKAKEELAKITQNFAKNPVLASQAQFMLGNLYEQQGRWNEAVLEYEKVTDLFPLTSMGLKTPIYVVEYYKRHKDKTEADRAHEKAIKHYQRIINEYSGTSIATVVKDYLALTYVSQDKWDNAIDVWQTIVNDYPESQAGIFSLFAIGETYVRQIKDLQKAIEVYEEFVRKNPTSKIIQQAKFQIGRLYFMKGDFAKAREIFKQVIKEYPKEIELCANSYLSVAACYEREGNQDKTMQIYRKIKHDYPTTLAALSVPLFTAQYYQRKNQIQEAEKAFQEAISVYDKVIRENPKTKQAARAQNFISLAYLSQKKWEKAIDSLRTLIEVYPENPKASASLFTIAAIYQRQLGEPKKAIETYKKFMEQYPGHTLANLAKSEIESLQKSIN